MDVYRLSTKGTELACLGEGTRYRPIISLVLQLGIILLAWNQFWRVYTGKPNGRFYLSLGATGAPVKQSIGLVPYFLSGNKFLMWLAYCRVYGHIEILIVLSHIYLDFWSCFHIYYCKYLIIFSKLPFWKWELTSQNKIVFLSSFNACVDMFDWNNPMYCLLNICFKVLLVFNFMIKGGYHMRVDVNEITIVINGYFCCIIALIGRYYLYLDKRYGLYDSNWSTETQSSGAVTCRRLPLLFGKLFHQGRRVMAPHMHP